LAKAKAQQGEEPSLGEIAAFALLAVALLESFVNTIWVDKPESHAPGVSDEKWFKRRTSLDKKIKDIGRGADDHQVLSTPDRLSLKEFIARRNGLLQHHKGKFESQRSTTRVRGTFTVEYGQEIYDLLRKTVQALSEKYGLDPSWV